MKKLEKLSGKKFEATSEVKGGWFENEGVPPKTFQTTCVTVFSNGTSKPDDIMDPEDIKYLDSLPGVH